MITVLSSIRQTDGSALQELIGLSTDTKPTENMCNGSSFYEMDTGFTSYYDATPSTGGWTEAPAGGDS